MKFIFQTFKEIKTRFLRTEKTKKLIHGSISSLFLLILSLITRVIMGIVIVRLLGVSNYGIYSYAITWLALLVIPTTLGLDHITLRYISSYNEKQSWANLKGLLRFASFIGFTAAILVSIVVISVIIFLPGIDWEKRITLLITLSILPLAVLTQVRQSTLRGLNHPVLAQIPEYIIYPTSLIFLLLGTYYLNGTKLSAPQAAFANIGAWFTAFLIGTGFLISKIPKAVKISPIAYEKKIWMEMIKPLLFSGGAYYIMSRGDLLILGAMASNRDVGLYSAASRMAEQLVLIVYSVTSFAGASLFSGIYSTGDIKELQRFATLSSKIIFWTTLPLYLLLLWFTPWILSYFGNEFMEATTVMRLLLTTFFLSSLTGNVINMLYMTGNQRSVAIIMGIMAIINIIFSFFLIPIYGYLGAAIASGTSLLLLHGILEIVLYKKVGIISLPFSIGKSTVLN